MVTIEAQLAEEEEQVLPAALAEADERPETVSALELYDSNTGVLVAGPEAPGPLTAACAAPLASPHPPQGAAPQAVTQQVLHIHLHQTPGTSESPALAAARAAAAAALAAAVSGGSGEQQQQQPIFDATGLLQGAPVPLALLPPAAGPPRRRRRARWRRVATLIAVGGAAALAGKAAVGLAARMDALAANNQALASRTRELDAAKEALLKQLQDLAERQAELADEKTRLSTRVSALSQEQGDLKERNSTLSQSLAALAADQRELQEESARLAADLRDANAKLVEAKRAEEAAAAAAAAAAATAREQQQQREREKERERAEADAAEARRLQQLLEQQHMQQLQRQRQEAAAAAAAASPPAKPGRAGDLTVQLVIPNFTQELLHQAAEKELPTQLAKALVSEAKESALLPSLVEGLAARGVNRLGNVVLPWRWFGGKGKGDGKDSPAAGES